MEVDHSRQLARVQIHVERVIGVLRQKYRILQSTIPINLLMHTEGAASLCILDKIVVVCCALCSCCQSVVPFE